MQTSITAITARFQQTKEQLRTFLKQNTCVHPRCIDPEPNLILSSFCCVNTNTDASLCPRSPSRSPLQPLDRSQGAANKDPISLSNFYQNLSGKAAQIHDTLQHQLDLCLKVLKVLITERAELHRQTPGGRYDPENELQLSKVSDAVRIKADQIRGLHATFMRQVLDDNDAAKAATEGCSPNTSGKSIPFLEEGILRMWNELEASTVGIVHRAKESLRTVSSSKVESETQAITAAASTVATSPMLVLNLESTARARCLVNAIRAAWGRSVDVASRCVSVWRLHAG